MGILNIRNLPDSVHSALRQRAAANGTSMEAEARAILTAAVIPRESLSPAQLQLFVKEAFALEEPTSMVDELIKDRRQEARNEH